MQQKEGNEIEIIKKLNKNFKSKFDALFLYLHALMQTYGFKVVGLGEDGNMIENKDLPDQWNLSDDSWAFRYKHFKSSMTFLLKGLKLSGKLIVYGIALEQNEVLNIELKVDDYVTNVSMNDFEHLYQNVSQLENLVLNSIIKKFIPSLSDLQSNQNTQSNQGINNSNNFDHYEPEHDPLRIPPRNPNYDPLRIPSRNPNRNRNFDPFALEDDYYNDFEVGRGDVNPQIPGYFNPGGGLVGPNHPGFGPSINDPYYNDPFGIGMPRDLRNNPNNRRRPPNSRFDHFGPPGNFGGGNPNNDHLPPPGWYS
jgi:hypothetical protein